MGISGLLPFLKNASRPTNLRDFSGTTIAIDVYCWLHKGAFGCAEQLVQGRPTDGYIKYVMKYVSLLLSHNIKPVLVFDGRNLPSKSETEKKRRTARKENREKAVQLLKEGKSSEARDYFQRCVDITPAMARQVIAAARERNIDCIVAPYEADSQLAFLNLSGLAQVVLTEDSDLTLFGCDKVIFKLKDTGDGVLYERSELGKVFGLRADSFSFEKFRYMCIMAGCDYLPSLQGIGLGKSKAFWQKVTNPDLNNVLRKIPAYLKMPSIMVTPDYIAGFIRANNTFLHQLVFDPVTRTERPLTPYPEDLQEACKRGELNYCGSYSPPSTALQLALGNLDLHSLEQVSYHCPDSKTEVQQSTYGSRAPHPSIWSKGGQLVNKGSKVVTGGGQAFSMGSPGVSESQVRTVQKSEQGARKRKAVEQEARKTGEQKIVSEERIAELLLSSPPDKMARKEDKIKRLVGDTGGGKPGLVSKYFSPKVEEGKGTPGVSGRRTATLPAESGAWFEEISRPTSLQGRLVYNPGEGASTVLQDISNSPDKEEKLVQVETPERVQRRNPFAKKVSVLTVSHTPLASSQDTFTSSPSIPSSQLSLYSMDGETVSFSQDTTSSQETTISPLSIEEVVVSPSSQEFVTPSSQEKVPPSQDILPPSSPAPRLGLSRFAFSGPGGGKQGVAGDLRRSWSGGKVLTGSQPVTKLSRVLTASQPVTKLGPARVSGLVRNKAPSAGMKQASLLSMFSRKEKKADLGNNT